MPRLFALDQNFPQPIVGVLAEFMREAELAPLREIDARLTVVDDWEVLLALHHHARAWDGLITTDTNMLSQAREIAVLLQTRLTLVVAAAAGHDPLKATGLVLAHLPWICHSTSSDEAQLWILRTANQPARDPWTQLERLALQQDTTAQALWREARLSRAELGVNPLA